MALSQIEACSEIGGLNRTELVGGGVTSSPNSRTSINLGSDTANLSFLITTRSG